MAASAPGTTDAPPAISVTNPDDFTDDRLRELCLLELLDLQTKLKDYIDGEVERKKERYDDAWQSITENDAYKFHSDEFIMGKPHFQQDILMRIMCAVMVLYNSDDEIDLSHDQGNGELDSGIADIVEEIWESEIKPSIEKKLLPHRKALRLLTRMIHEREAGLP